VAVDPKGTTNAALKRNHLEIAGMRSSFSLTNLPGSVTSCLNGVPVKGLDETAARNLQVDDCVRGTAPFRTRLDNNGQTSILTRISYDVDDLSGHCAYPFKLTGPF
jgi:hypothetical protein